MDSEDNDNKNNNNEDNNKKKTKNREFYIGTSGQFRTLAMFSLLMKEGIDSRIKLKPRELWERESFLKSGVFYFRRISGFPTNWTPHS